MSRALVTGVAGVIGSHVAEHCLRLGFQVVGVDDLSEGFIENVSVSVDFRRGPVTDAAWGAGLWADGDYDVVHAFASHDKARRVFQPERPMPLTEGLQRMAQWARQREPMPPTDFGAIEVPINLPPSWSKS